MYIFRFEKINFKGILLLQALCFSGLSGEKGGYETQDSVFTDIKEKYYKKYKECSQDTSEHSLKEILDWKRKKDEITETPEYRDMLKEFVYHTGVYSGFLPCEVINWYEERKDWLETKEDSVRGSIIEYNSAYIDTLEMRKELKNTSESNFDIFSIPFGLSRPVLNRVMQLRVNYPLLSTDSSFLTEHYHIKATPFYIELITGENGIYNKYMISGYPHPIEQLDSKNRTEARIIKDFIFSKIKREPQVFRVGRFDIKGQGITPQYEYKDKRHSCIIGFTEDDTRIVTRALVKFNPMKKTAGADE